MALYTDESKERVRDAIDMVELVGARTELRRAGADSYVGPLPVPRGAHARRSASSPPTKVYYCFGCQAAGDAFTFVQETEGARLPRRARVPRRALRRRARARRRRTRARPSAAGAARPPARAARPHLRLLRARAVGISRGRCGARVPRRPRPRGGDAARVPRRLRAERVGSRAARARGATASREAELLATGLVQRSRERPGSVYDRFRRRITFPLCDQRGRVLGLRRARDGRRRSAPSTSTAPTARSTTRAGTSSRRISRALTRPRPDATVLCEGYTDVIAAHQAGVRNCVGLMGTALTDEQVGELRAPGPDRACSRSTPTGPGQAAMLKAAERGREAAASSCASPRCPPASDPADVLQRDGPAAVREADRRLGAVRALPRRADPRSGRPRAPRRVATGSSTSCGRSSRRLAAGRDARGARARGRRAASASPRSSSRACSPEARRGPAPAATPAAPARGAAAGGGRAHRARVPRAVHRAARPRRRAARRARHRRRLRRARSRAPRRSHLRTPSRLRRRPASTDAAARGAARGARGPRAPRSSRSRRSSRSSARQLELARVEPRDRRRARQRSGAAERPAATSARRSSASSIAGSIARSSTPRRRVPERRDGPDPTAAAGVL